MKKLLIITMILIVSLFTGCSNRNYTPDSWSKVEPKGDASVFLRGAYVNAEEVHKKLESAGFEILADYESIRDGITVVFTNETLKKEASKPNRAHIATMRIFVDKKEQMISITNPVYFGKAYMQEDYNFKIFDKIKINLHKLFPGLVHSANAREYKNIDDFNVGIAFPKYEDFKTIAKDSNKNLLQKFKDYDSGSNIVYILNLSKGTTIVGYDISKKAKRSIKKYG